MTPKIYKIFMKDDAGNYQHLRDISDSETAFCYARVMSETFRADMRVLRLSGIYNDETYIVYNRGN